MTHPDTDSVFESELYLGTHREARRALFAFDELLFSRFAFVTNRDRLAAVALFLSMHWRPFYKGLAPLFIVDGAPGVGKTTLIRALAAAVYSHPEQTHRAMWPGTQTAQFALLSTVAHTPNIALVHLGAKELEGTVIEALQTADWLTCRVARTPQTVTLPQRAVWVLDAERTTVAEDVARRAVRITLELPPKRKQSARAFSLAPSERARLTDASYALLRIMQGAEAPAYWFAKYAPLLRENPGPSQCYASWYGLVHRVLVWLTDEDVFAVTA